LIRHRDRTLRSAFQGDPETGENHLHNWSVEMPSLFCVVSREFPSRCGVRNFFLSLAG
jgi:hypothetical protein